MNDLGDKMAWYDLNREQLAALRAAGYTPGSVGTPGATGPKGDTGNTGPQGPAGADGAFEGSFGGWIYGTGEDGALVCTDGMVIQPGNYTDVTIPEGVTVTVPWALDEAPIIRCTGTWTINGTIDLRGLNAINSHGALEDVLVLPNGDPDTNGQAFRYAGAPPQFRTPFLSGVGGDGASGPAGPLTVQAKRSVLDPIRLLAWVPAGNAYWFADYGIGGTGSGDIADIEATEGNSGGAGGVGGKFFGLFARHLIHGPDSSYLIAGGNGAPGGDDGTGSTGHGDCGGGGGGAGGWWVTISDDITGDTAVIGAGGLGGAGCGTGTDGSPGMAGTGIHYLNRME